jgi:hypothetical protein
MQPELITKTLEAVFKELSSAKKDLSEMACNELTALLDEKERKHIRPQGLRAGILTVHIDSPAWMYTLNLKKAWLLQQLQEKIGRDALKDIRLRIGAL